MSIQELKNLIYQAELKLRYSDDHVDAFGIVMSIYSLRGSLIAAQEKLIAAQEKLIAETEKRVA